jgi:polysaccharide export outer membrane protein
MWLKAVIWAIGASLCLTGCSGRSVPPSTEIATQAPPAVKLGAGDRVRVVVFGETTLTGEYLVGNEGKVVLPLIGSVEVTGKTVAELEASIAGALTPDFMLDPKVSVDIVSFRPYFILGEVGKPGQYAYVSALSVEQAVAAAGGYTYRATTKLAYIRRSGNMVEQSFELRPDRPIWVMPGDTIRIGERYF